MMCDLQYGPLAVHTFDALACLWLHVYLQQLGAGLLGMCYGGVLMPQAQAPRWPVYYARSVDTTFTICLMLPLTTLAI